MTTAIRTHVTATADVETAYEPSIAFGVAAGLYIGGATSDPYLLLWFEGDTASDQCEAIDRAVDALGALKREARAATAPEAEDPGPPVKQREPVAASPASDDDIPF